MRVWYLQSGSLTAATGRQVLCVSMEMFSHQCLQSSRDHEAKTARRADGLDSVKKSLCTSTSIGRTLLHEQARKCIMLLYYVGRTAQMESKQTSIK